MGSGTRDEIRDALDASPWRPHDRTPPPRRSRRPRRARRVASRVAELTAIAGYQINTDVSTTGGDLSVEDAPVYGAALALVSSPGLRAELLWLYSNPTVHASGSTLLNTSAPFHVPTHYFQIGGSRGLRYDRLEPFLGGTLGAALFLPSRLEYSNGTSTSLSDTWRFAFTFGGGLNIHLSEKVALRGEARVAAPVYFSSGSIYVGGGGAALGVSGGIPIWQWNFLGGLVFSP
jgi:hypothetical protein